jgi:hypothetical protein
VSIIAWLFTSAFFATSAPPLAVTIPPSLVNLGSSLTSFVLNNANIVGTIPAWMGTTWPNLRILYAVAVDPRAIAASIIPLTAGACCVGCPICILAAILADICKTTPAWSALSRRKS